MTEQIKPASAKPERLVIISKGYGFRYEKDFFTKIQEAFDNGYRIADAHHRNDVSMRNFRGSMGRAVMYLEGCEPAPKEVAKVEAVAEPQKDESIIVKEEVEEISTGAAENAPMTPLEELETLSKAKELKEFAKKHNVEIPKGTNSPKAIKKVIQEALENLETLEA